MLANVFTKTILDRWKGVTIGTVGLGAMLLFGMMVYRDIDLTIYNQSRPRRDCQWPRTNRTQPAIGTD